MRPDWAVNAIYGDGSGAVASGAGGVGSYGHLSLDNRRLSPDRVVGVGGNSGGAVGLIAHLGKSGSQLAWGQREGQLSGLSKRAIN